MRSLVRPLLTTVALLALAGCGAAPSPESATPPAAAPANENPNVVANASDSVGSIPGSPDAQFVFKFRQTEPGGGSGFTFRDRDLSFWFRPSPNVLYFQVENLQGRPVWIDWDHCTFLDPLDRTGKAAHSTTTWRERFATQAQTQVPGLQRYSDYVFPIDYLLDPGPNDTQLRRPLLPEDTSAPTYSGKTFGVDLAFLVEGQPRTYTFRYRVDSVIPR